MSRAVTRHLACRSPAGGASSRWPSSLVVARHLGRTPAAPSYNSGRRSPRTVSPATIACASRTKTARKVLMESASGRTCRWGHGSPTRSCASTASAPRMPIAAQAKCACRPVRHTTPPPTAFAPTVTPTPTARSNPAANANGSIAWALTCPRPDTPPRFAPIRATPARWSGRVQRTTFVCPVTRASTAGTTLRSRFYHDMPTRRGRLGPDDRLSSRGHFAAESFADLAAGRSTLR